MTRQSDNPHMAPSAGSAGGGPRVVVVGGGVGGLVSALELSARGCDVTLLEAAAVPGGKLRQVQLGGRGIDAGPTVFTMRWVFDELFDSIGERFDADVRLAPLALLARHAWNADERLDLFASRERSADAIGDFAGAAAARGYLAFCERAERIYTTLEGPFLRGSRPNPFSLAARAGVRGLPGLLGISPLASMWSELGKYFADPRLHQLFGRYATYCGASPYRAPATLMLVAHVEQAGVWQLQGGLQALARALAARAEQRGARIRCGSRVARILLHGGRAAGVRLDSGEELMADAVVFNGDAAALCQGLLGDGVRGAVPSVPPAGRSLSALTWNLLAPTSGFELAHHTVFFSANYAAEFDDIFQRRRLPAAPTVYVCAQDRGEAGTAASLQGSAERLLLIVNAPARGDAPPFTDQELQACETRTFDLLQRAGLQLQRRPELTRLTTPQHFEQLFPATGGALYGAASHGWLASFRRPGSRCRIPGLYLAGGSVHPGPGVPMAALSGRQAAASVLTDCSRRPTGHRPSTAPCPSAVMPGGTSTP